MSRIGVIYCAYQTDDLVPRSLGPWIEARRTQLGGNTFVICAISVPFTGFDTSGEPEDTTRSILGAHAQAGDIDHAIVRDKPMKETEARGLALRWLVEQGVETVIQWDSDELGTVDEIGRILAFWTARSHLCWARLSYRNLVFTPDQWLVEPFTPPRIHRVRVGNAYEARSFWDDNNVAYHGIITRDIKRDLDFASVVVPKSVAWIRHETWLSNDRSRRKQAYQWARWGRSDFAWDDSRGGLVWRDGVNPPETARDE